MMKWLKKYWGDPVWSKVIAWLIIGLLGVIGIAIKSVVEKTSFVETTKQIINYLINTKISINIFTLIIIIIFIGLIFRYSLKKVAKRQPKFVIKKRGESPLEKEMKAIKAEHQKEQELMILSKINDCSTKPENAMEIFRRYGYFNENIRQFIFTHKNQMDPELYKQIAIRV